MKNKQGFVKIDKVISRVAKEKKLENALYKQQVLKTWNRAIKGFFENGEELTKAVDFKQGCLVIACLSKHLSYQIKLLAQRIIEALNKILGKKLVFQLRIDF